MVAHHHHQHHHYSIHFLPSTNILLENSLSEYEIIRSHSVWLTISQFLLLSVCYLYLLLIPSVMCCTCKCWI